MKIILFLIIILIVNPFTLSSQNIEEWINENEKVPLEKIYLHTDAEYYFQDDTIWFKIYLTDSRSEKLIPRAENIYVQLLDKNGNTATRAIFLSVNGQASGHLAIPQNITPDNYLLQAYTDYLLNFEETTWYSKRFNISRKPLTSRTSGRTGKNNAVINEVTFYPQGEVLLENLTNLVAFKAQNRAGSGIKARGSVMDERGQTVVTFETDYKGMGLFFLTPEEGKTYTARINGFQNFRHTFEPVKEGIKMQVVNHTSNEIILNIAGNSDKFSGKTFYMANMHRGKVLFYHPFVLIGLNQVMKFNSQILGAGVNRLVLLDINLNPVSECFLFSNSANVNVLETNTDKNVYGMREKVHLEIKGQEEYSDVVSNLSMSVIHSDALENSRKSNTILTYFLLDSELNGFYENSNDFFVEDEISPEAKMRLLMLTSGWGEYLWNSIPNNREDLAFKQRAGLNIYGIANNALTEKPLKNADITMIIEKDGEMAFLNQTTNEIGEFTFPGLLYNDSAIVNIQAKNQKGGMNTSIELFQPFPGNSKATGIVNILNENKYSPEKLKELKYISVTNKPRVNNRRALRKSLRKEIPVPDGHFRLYDDADFVLEVQESESFDNVLDYMIGKVPGVDISGKTVRVRGTSGFGVSGAPLFLLDGIPVNQASSFELPEGTGLIGENEGELDKKDEELIQAVRSIPLNDVQKIEVLKSPQNLAVFGARGANGVIAIYTQKGITDGTSREARGILEKKIMGYSSFKKMDAPDYSLENVSESKDFRITLFWEPEITLENGKTIVTFYTSDQSGLYKIFVEGMTENGTICLGETEFEVH